jgi:hypothetical protein
MPEMDYRDGKNVFDYIEDIFKHLEYIESKLDTLIQHNKIMDPIYAKLAADVATETTLEQSLVTLLGNYYQQVIAIPGLSAAQIAAVTAIDTSVNANSANLTAAVTANTPVSTTTGS